MAGKSSRFLVAVLALVGLLPAAVFAACPAAPVGSTSDTVVILKHLSDSAGIGPVSQLDATREGSLVYDSVAKSLKYCDGTDWTELSMGGRIVTGSYVGNGAASQTIVLGFRPSMVIVKGVGGTFGAFGVAIDGISDASVHLRMYAGGSVTDATQPKITSNGFNALFSANASTFNASGVTYHYVAIGSTTLEVVNGCPSGFSQIGDPGKPGSFCIDTIERTATTWNAAQAVCHGLNDAAWGKAYMCNNTQWYAACKAGTPTDMTNNREWVSDLTASTTAVDRANGGTCEGVADTAITSNLTYRCCFQ